MSVLCSFSLLRPIVFTTMLSIRAGFGGAAALLAFSTLRGADAVVACRFALLFQVPFSDFPILVPIICCALPLLVILFLLS